MSRSGPTVLVVGGGTAGHIEPALAVGEAVRAMDSEATVIAVGTPKGLESDLVPRRGFPLELVDPVPLPRKVNADLFKLPGRVLRATRQARRLVEKTDADVIVGFGGYACVPMYLAMALARGKRKIPVVVHEANSSAGLANKIGARIAVTTLAAVSGSGLDGAEVVGNPVRAAIAGLDRDALRADGRAHFGLDPDAPTVLVFGGSQGAQRINQAFEPVAAEFGEAGVGVLHAVGPTNTITVDRPDPPAGGPAYSVVPYIDRMDLAYAAADLVVCRSGAITVAEVSAVGLPAVFVPLPIGNGEQAKNARDLVAAGGARIVDNADFDADFVRREVLPIAASRDKLDEMAAAALRSGSAGAAEHVASVALEVARSHRGGGRTSQEKTRK